MEPAKVNEYSYESNACGHMHALLLPVLLKELSASLGKTGQESVFDLGCGNGSVAQAVSQAGFHITGCDVSTSGIENAKRSWPHLNLSVGSGYDDLKSRFGEFPQVYSLEVIEHVYDPRLVVKRVCDMLPPGGRFILSTPYHGYWKNLVLALTGKMDSHFTALWDHGHIKFWSPDTLTSLLEEGGFKVLRVHRLGRIPALAMTMLVVAEKV